MELGGLQDVEFICLDPQDPDQDVVAGYRQIHPHGTVPCLQVEGRGTILESGAICMYLADVYDKLGPDLDREAYYNWIIYSVATLDEVMETIFVQWVFTDLQDQDTDLIDKMIRKFEVFAKHLTETLAHRDYICGSRLTAADCVLGYNLWWAYALRDGILLFKFPGIKRYYERLARRSAFQRTFTEIDPVS